MENSFPFIIWVVIVFVISTLAKKKAKKTEQRPLSPRGRQMAAMSGLPPEVLELLKEAGESAVPPSKPKPPHATPTKPRIPAKPRQAVLAKSTDAHVGESYASPIPDPYASPMIGKKTPSQRHAESHIGPVEVKDNLKKHGPSAAAKHADAHIATTQAVPTPQSGVPRKSPLADWIPRGERGLRKALVMSEILGAPKSLR